MDNQHSFVIATAASVIAATYLLSALTHKSQPRFIPVATHVLYDSKIKAFVHCKDKQRPSKLTTVVGCGIKKD